MIMKKILVGFTLFLFTLSAQAALRSYDLVYTSATTAATATASITIDDTIFANVAASNNQSAALHGITAFSITVSGAISGNGTFTLADFTTFVFTQTGPYDLSTDLFAQAVHLDFNMFTAAAPAPHGVAPNVIGTNFTAGGEDLILRSFRPATAAAIPSLPLWALTLMGLLLLSLVRKRITQ